MLKQVSPALVRVGVMSNPYIAPQTKFFLEAIETAAPTFGIQVCSAFSVLRLGLGYQHH